MIAFTDMLVAPAMKAGIKVPVYDCEDYNPEEYPNWHVYRMSQLGAPMPHPSAAADNAAVIAKFSEEEVKRVTFADLEEAGCVYGLPMP